MPSERNTLSYRDAGVDIDAGASLVERIRPAAAATTRPGVLGGLGGFGALFDTKAAGFRDPVLVATTDGVGTKLKIAIESGEHATLGIDLVAMCVNDLVVQGAEPLIFLDYFATSALNVEQAATIIEGIAEGCRIAGAALVGGETAEMPGLYSKGDYDLAGFAVGAVERDQILPRDVEAGDVILGLASAGLHSNGFSLVRRVAEMSGLGWSDPAPFEPDAKLGAALLRPTRIYVRACLDAIRETGGGVKALAHITGGGLVDNVPRIVPDDLAAEIDLAAIDVPPVFKWLAGPVAPAEMLRTFNCGIGMVVVVAAEAAAAATAIFERHGEKVVTLGRIAPRTTGAVALTGHLDLDG